MQQDATRQMGDARLDAAQSSLLRDGSVPVREQALATRLQTRIQDEAAAAMRNAQSLYNRANMEQYMGRANARAQKTAAAGTLLSGFAQGGNALLNGEAIGDSWRPISGNRNLPEEPPQAPEGLPAPRRLSLF